MGKIRIGALTGAALAAVLITMLIRRETDSPASAPSENHREAAERTAMPRRSATSDPVVRLAPVEFDPATLKEDSLRQWASERPQDAARWSDSLPEDELSSSKRLLIALAWAGRDLPNAVQWVSRWPEEQWGNAMRSVAYEASREDPENALAIAMAMPEAAGRSDLIGHAAAQFASRNPEAAIAWAAEIEEGVLRDRIHSRIATAIGEIDPISGVTLAYETIPPGRNRDDAIVGVVQRWAQRQPEEAAAWADALPPGDLRDTSLANIERLRPQEE